MNETIEKKAGWRRFIGDRSFYHTVIVLALPIVLQNGITNLVSLLDNVMVGLVGTDPMSGVAIANQLFFVFNLTIFGAVSGAGIFGAQFFGSGNIEGLRHSFRYKMWICLMLSVLGIGLLYFFDDQLISLYLVPGEVGDVEKTLEYGKNYLHIMLLGVIPFAVVQVYASTLRETGKTVLPMMAGVAAVLVNCSLNIILIFGHLGAPRLGVNGAAIATVISRFVELLIVVLGTHLRKKQNPFIEHAYRSFKIPRKLVWQITVTGAPLMLNETIWAMGQAMLQQQYAQRGLEVVSGMNISSTLFNLFSIFFMAMGNVVAIMVGQRLGEGDLKKAKTTAVQLIFTSTVVSTFSGVLLISVSGLFPQIYETEQVVKDLATRFLIVAGSAMPINGFLHAAYFTIRSGGKTVITFLFDSVFVWAASIPLSFVLVKYTTLPIVAVYACVLYADLIKCVIGYVMVKKGIWLNKIV